MKHLSVMFLLTSTLAFTQITSFNSRTGAVTLNNTDVTTALSANGTLYANTFPGESVSARINAAIATCPFGFSCNVVIPSTMGSGTYAGALPAGVTIFDYRHNGLNIFSNTTKNASGSGCGLGVFVNAPNPAIGPIAANCVGIYTEVNSDSSLSDIWGANPVANVYSGKIVNAVGSEVDLNNFGINIPNPFDGAKGKTLGLTVVSGGTIPATAQILTGSYDNSAAWNHGIVLDSLIQDALSFTSFPNHSAITQAITSRASPQTVAVNSALTMKPGSIASVDAGLNQEDVTIVGSDRVANTVSAVFSKNHPANSQIYEYTAVNGLDFSGTIFQGNTLILGNLQTQALLNSLHYPSMAIRDSKGTIRTTDWYGAGSNERHINTIGGGLFVTNSANTNLIAIDESTGNASYAGKISAPNVCPANGFNGTKTAGSCTFTIRCGIITAVSGC
jgi:hypothetical protein